MTQRRHERQERRDEPAAEDVRIVTPENPLVINETDVTFEHVVIEGGEILTEVPTKVRFGILEKKS